MMSYRSELLMLFAGTRKALHLRIQTNELLESEAKPVSKIISIALERLVFISDEMANVTCSGVVKTKEEKQRELRRRKKKARSEQKIKRKSGKKA